MKKAWLITLTDWSGKLDNNIVDILDSRVWDNKIKELMERYYMNTQFLSDRLKYAKNKVIPYPAELDKFSGVITCWDTPLLEAKIVENLEVKVDWNGKQYLKYNMISRENIINKIKKLES